MRTKTKNDGSVLIVVVFTIALLAALVAGILQLDTEQIQIMKNEVFAAEAIAIAEAGIADAFSQLRSDPNWSSGSSSFGGGSYTVTIAGTPLDPNITSIGTSPQGFVATVKAEITISGISPYVIRIDKLRINE